MRRSKRRRLAREKRRRRRFRALMEMISDTIRQGVTGKSIFQPTRRTTAVELLAEAIDDP
jgi:retron-type reverse transcriptase